MSVVVVCYNHCRFVGQCLESVCRQSYSNIEIIVIDNGSTDDSVAQIERSEYRDRFTFIRNPETTLVQSLIDAKSIIRGTYLSVVSADDYWSPSKIETQVEFMECNPRCGVCTGIATTVDADGNLIDVPKLSGNQPLHYSFDDIFLGDIGLRACVATYRRAALESVGWFDKRFEVEDFYMYLKLSAGGWDAVLLPVVQGFYRLHGGNISLNYPFVYEQLARIFDQYSDHVLYRRVIDRLNARFFSIFARTKKNTALQMFWRLRLNASTIGYVMKGLVRLVLPGSLELLIRQWNLNSWSGADRRGPSGDLRNFPPLGGTLRDRI